MTEANGTTSTLSSANDDSEVIASPPAMVGSVADTNADADSKEEDEDTELVEMPNVLILQHIVPRYQDEFGSESYLDSVIDSIQNTNHSLVILTLPYRDEKEFEELKPYISARQLWQLLGCDTIDCAVQVYGGQESDYIYAGTDGTARIYDWIRKLAKTGCHVYVAGGHRRQCLDGMITTLKHLKIKYTVVEHCVYPTQ